MKKIIKTTYLSEADDVEFDDERDCLIHELAIDIVETIEYHPQYIEFCEEMIKEMDKRGMLGDVA